MKTVEKKCPNCKKSFEFDENSVETICPNCKRKFHIEKSFNKKTKRNTINLVMKTQKRVYIIPVAIILIIVLLLAFASSKGKYSYSSSNDIVSEKNLSSLSDISQSDAENLKSKSLSIINLWNKTDNNCVLSSSKNIGYYLLKGKELSYLYDVYELIYTISDKNYTIYTAVCYNNITYENYLDYRNTQLHGATQTIDNYTLWGYESIEDLYNDIQNPLKYKVISSKKLYKN